MKLVHCYSVLKRSPRGLILVLCAACNDFPQEPPLGVTIEPSQPWPTTMSVTDDSVLEVKVTDGHGRPLKGLNVEWSSSDDGIVTISKRPPEGPTLQDSLAAQLKAKVTARRTGHADIVAVVTHPGFQRAEVREQIAVTRWPVAPATSWPEIMTVTETTKVRLVIGSAEAAIAKELRVLWQSSDEAVLRVTRDIPPEDASDSATLASKLTATLVAHGRDSAVIAVTVERPGFEPSEYRQWIQVKALRMVPSVTWPDTLMVGDSVLLQVGVKNHKDSTLAGRPVDWNSSDLGILSVKQEGSRTSATVRAVRRGSAMVSAFVSPAGFEAAETTKSVRVMERWRTVSAGTDHTCAIAFDSTAYCWGASPGNGRTSDVNRPVPVLGTGELRYQSLSAGDFVSCGIVSIGLAFCWGSGEHGRLGNDDTNEIDQFIPVPVARSLPFALLDAGPAVCGLSGNLAWCWGTNLNLQLGRDPNQPPGITTCSRNIGCGLKPESIPTAGDNPDGYADIAVGGIHVCAVTLTPESGLAYCWGVGNTGALGDGSTTSSALPVRVLTSITLARISAGGTHTCALTTDSLVAYCWGSNSRGQLGVPTLAICAGSVPCSTTPVSTGWRFRLLSAGGAHTCGIRVNTDDVYCWGRGESGQLGSLGFGDKAGPTLAVGGHKFQSISAGEEHTCGVTVQGAVYCWGKGANGRLGTGLFVNEDVPMRVAEPN